MVETKMNFQVQIVIFYQNEMHLDLTNSFWSSPNQFGQTKIILEDQNCFGHIEEQGIS